MNEIGTLKKIPTRNEIDFERNLTIRFPNTNKGNGPGKYKGYTGTSVLTRLWNCCEYKSVYLKLNEI